MENNMAAGIKNIEAKQDALLDGVTEIKVELAGIKEHLRTLNGSVARHDKEINENRVANNELTKKMAYYAGGLAVIVFLSSIVIKFI